MARTQLKLVSSTESSEEELRAMAQVDRDRAFERLVQLYRDRIYFHALYICKDSEEAFDVAQEVFVKAYHEPRLFEDGFRARAWLFRVCTNRCYNLVRDRQRRREILERLGKQTDVLNEQHRAVDTVLAKELSAGMGQAMDSLSPEHRNVLLLRYYQDLSYQEISNALGIKIGTVMSRLSRAKIRLQQVLSDEVVR